MNSLDILITKSAFLVVQHTQSGIKNSNVEFWQSLVTAKAYMFSKHWYKCRYWKCSTVQDPYTVQKEKGIIIERSSVYFNEA